MHLEHHPPSNLKDTLRKATRLVDEETGIIRLLHEPPIAPGGPRIFGCGSLCSDYSALGYPSESSVSGSTSLVRDQAIAGAIGEAIERYSAAFVPDEQLIYATYESIADRAVSPRSLTLYGIDQYDQGDFGYQPVRPGTSLGWVWGHSLTSNTPTLVPAFGVYQPYQSRHDEPPVIQQITTGLACGNTLEEAILSALCEVVERDAAMLMWLQYRRAPKVVPSRTRDSLLSRAFCRFSDLQKQVTLLDVTTDVGIPAYVAVWDGPVNRNKGAIFASCANLCAERAAVGALTELAQCMMWAASLTEGRKALPDPAVDLFSRIEDHVLWPLAAHARPAFEFALSSERRVDLDVHPDASTPDVLRNIQTCARLLADRGLDAIVVDVTAPDVRECGFHVVRVVVPGAQPLFFGKGLHRVSERARANPYPDRASTALNFHPHPYP